MGHQYEEGDVQSGHVDPESTRDNRSEMCSQSKVKEVTTSHSLQDESFDSLDHPVDADCLCDSTTLLVIKGRQSKDPTNQGPSPHRRRPNINFLENTESTTDDPHTLLLTTTSRADPPPSRRPPISLGRLYGLLSSLRKRV